MASKRWPCSGAMSLRAGVEEYLFHWADAVVKGRAAAGVEDEVVVEVERRGRMRREYMVAGRAARRGREGGEGVVGGGCRSNGS